MTNRERLFRDDAGAALERAARLEDENAQLRAELTSARQERTRVRRRRATRPIVVFLEAAGVLFLLGGLVAILVKVATAPRSQPLPPPLVASAAAPPIETATALPAPFERGAAAAALGAVDLHDCKQAAWPSGVGHVIVTFAPDGSVRAAAVDAAPFTGTTVGACVAARFGAVRIRPFDGAPVTVGKSFVVE